MNKHITLFSAFLLFVVFGFAQAPVITQNNMAFVVGDSYTVHIGTSGGVISPGASGASQTWDLSTLSSSSSPTYTFVAPSATPNGSFFPGSTVSTNNTYYKSGSTALQFMGLYNSANYNIIYSDLEDQMRFPFNYQDTYTDAWAAVVTTSTTINRTGSSVVTADGWGDVTTPGGTFTNVMRVHLVQTYSDDIGITYSNDEYLWYCAGIHYPVATVFTFIVDFGGPVTSYGSSYITGVSGIDLVSNNLNLSIFPNPACDHISILFNANQNEVGSIGIINYLGQNLFQTNDIANEMNIPTTEFSAGQYFLVMRNKEGELVATRSFVIN